MQVPLLRPMSVIALAASVIVAVSCAQSPTSPSAVNSGLAASAGDGSGRVTINAVGDVTNSTPVVGAIKVCKVFAAGSNPAITSAQFAVSSTSVNGGTGTTAPSPVTVVGATCKVVAESAAPAGTGINVRIDETSPTAPQSIACAFSDPTPCTFTDGGTLFINAFHGYTLTYTNFIAPPAPGDEGCTPGYWKNHLDSWAGYSANASFNTTFGIGTNWFPNSLTLLQAAEQGGGGEIALARHAVAALLNAFSTGVDYPLTTAQVIQLVKDAYNGTKRVETVKNQLETNNELGCPLN